MNKFAVVVMGIFLSMTTFISRAQNLDEPRTIFTSEKINGFGQLDIKYSMIKESPVLILGGMGGVILNRHVLVGISAHSSAFKVDIAENLPNRDLYLHMGYSGLSLGYIIAPIKVVHLSIPLTIGAGKVNIYDKLSNDFNATTTYVALESSLFLFAEPSIQLEINVTNFLKLALGGSYRINHSLELESPVDSSDLNNWTGSFSVVIGKF